VNTLVRLSWPAHTPAGHVVLLPPAGGGAATYRGWEAWIDGELALWGVRLPGRESRLAEAPVANLDDATDTVLAEIADLTGPIALFGHSFGALLAHCIAGRLEAGRRPVALAGLAGIGPRRPEASRRGESDADLAAMLTRLGGTPTEVIADQRLLAAVLPAVRADLAAADGALPVTGPVLAAPVALFGGLSDPSAPREALLGWRAFTGGELGIRMFPGNHFFVATAAEPVARAFATDLRRHLNGSRSLPRTPDR
jgi:surfactin synthase thioesterase subunit